MSTLKVMETDLFDLLRRYIKERNDETTARLAEHEAELKERKCTAPDDFGRWIDTYDFPFLIEALMLNDAIFTAEYPTVKLTEEERKGFAYALEAHCEECAHCALKRASDLEWQSRVNRALAENKEAISEIIASAIGKR